MPKLKVSPKLGTKGSRARKATTSSATVTSGRRTKRKNKDSETGPQSKRQRILVPQDGTDAIYSAHNITTSEGSPEMAAGTSRNKGKQRQAGTETAASAHKRKGRYSQTSEKLLGRGGKRGSGSQYSSTVVERERPSRSKRVSVGDPSGTESSDSEQAGPSGGSTRSRKKRRSSVGGGSTSFRRSGSDSVTSTESSDSEGERGRGNVQEVIVSSARWQPVSEEACKALSNAMLSALGQCVTVLSGSRKKQAERELQELTRRVTQKLQSAIGPTAGRMKSYSGMKQKVAELKENCLGLVKRNSDLEHSLENRERVTTDIQDKAEQLLDAVSSAPTPSSPAEFPDPPEGADTDEDVFMNYVADLAENSRVASSRSGQTIC